jgi:hypothetical protein
MSRLLGIAFLALVLGSCSGSKIVKDNTDKCFPMRMDGDEYKMAKTTGLKIINMQIDNGCLIIEYQMKNACKNTDFDLHWDYRVKKSLPPQATLKLNQTGDNDCGLTLKGKKKFDLKELTNPAFKGKIYLSVPPSTEKILFEFKTQS